MKRINLERWWEIKWALFKAGWYCMWHPPCRVHIENTWVEDRGTRNEWHENEWVEHIEHIAVIKGSIIKSNLVVVKEYFGEPRIPLEIFNVDAK